MPQGSNGAVTAVLFTMVCAVSVLPPAGAEEGSWEISLGGGSMYAPVYQGSDDMELRALPMVNVEWNERAYLNVPRGAGVHLYRGNGLLISSGLGYSGRRDDDGDIAGIGDINGALTLNGSVEYRVGPVVPHVTLTQHLGGTDGLTAEMGLRAMIPLGVFFGAVPTDGPRADGPPPGPVVMLGFSSEWADETHMERYFGIDSEQAGRSGLSRYDADAGFYTLGATVGVMYALRTHWLVNGTFGYTWLVGDAEESPIVRDSEYFNGGMFVSYRF